MSADSIEKIAYRKRLDERVLFEEHATKMHADWFAWDSRTETYVEPICQAQWIGWCLARALPSAELERDAGREAVSSIDYWQKRGHVCKTCGGHGVIRGGSPLHHLGTWADKCADCDGTNIWDARASEAQRQEVGR